MVNMDGIIQLKQLQGSAKYFENIPSVDLKCKYGSMILSNSIHQAYPLARLAEHSTYQKRFWQIEKTEKRAKYNNYIEVLHGDLMINFKKHIFENFMWLHWSMKISKSLTSFIILGNENIYHINRVSTLDSLAKNQHTGWCDVISTVWNNFVNN